MEKNIDYNRGTTQYQLFYGKQVANTVKLNEKQAKNTVDGIAYRIPTLWSVESDEKRTVLAAFDMSESGGDCGRIQVMQRRSTDGAKTFSEMKTVLSMPVRKAPQKGGEYSCAFAIDPILVECQNGDMLMIVDVYPESKGIMRKSWVKKGSGYVNIGGKNYLALYAGKTGVGGGFKRYSSAYTVRDNGFIYTPDGEKTNYYLPAHHSEEYAFETAGDMYYAVGTPDYIDKCPPLIPEEGEGRDIYCGNIFLSQEKRKLDLTKPQKVTKRIVSPNKTGELYSCYDCVETEAAPLSILVTSYLWVLRSTDNGETWKQPVDITVEVKQKEIFLGTGPGVALRLSNQKDKSKNGRILAPVYNLKQTAVIISDDNGKTWKRSQPSRNIDETQLIELSDGTVMCFGRQKKLDKTPLSISYDAGETWVRADRTKLSAVKCQKSFLKVSKHLYTDEMDKDKDYIIACNTSGTYQQNNKRFGGMLTVGRVDSKDTITWLKQRRLHADGISGEYDNFFAYSSLAALDDGNFAVFYEAAPGAYGVLEKFSLKWLLDGEDAFTFPIKR